MVVVVIRYIMQLCGRVAAAEPNDPINLLKCLAIVLVDLMTSKNCEYNIVELRGTWLVLSAVWPTIT